MKINELRPGLNNVALTAKIVEMSEPRQINTKFGTTTTLTEAMLSDESGRIKIALWGQQSEGIEEGATVEVKGGFVKEFKGESQLGIGRGGSIKVIG
ncbi:MAG: DNA-binding protein [Candidatus Aenigmatarchaeota archaeon]|nr:DNA-binding protein [Candidatus Aenigmarchaeota archaeon]